jgi:hypothetical protein
MNELKLGLYLIIRVELCDVKFMDCYNLWAHLRVGCMYALFRFASGC